MKVKLQLDFKTFRILVPSRLNYRLVVLQTKACGVQGSVKVSPKIVRYWTVTS